MHIVTQSAPFSFTISPFPLLPAPPKRLMLPAPKREPIAGLLPAVCGGQVCKPALTEIVDKLHGRGHRAAPTEIVGELGSQDSRLATQDSSLITHESSLSFSPQPSALDPQPFLEPCSDAWWDAIYARHGLKSREEMDAELIALMLQIRAEREFLHKKRAVIS